MLNVNILMSVVLLFICNTYIRVQVEARQFNTANTKNTAQGGENKKLKRVEDHKQVIRSRDGDQESTSIEGIQELSDSVEDSQQSSDSEVNSQTTGTKQNFTSSEADKQDSASSNNGKIPDNVNTESDVSENSNLKSDDVDTRQSSKEFENDDHIPDKTDPDLNSDGILDDKNANKGNCWMTFKSTKHFEILDDLDAEYSADRLKYQAAVGTLLEKQLLDDLVSNRGAAERAKYRAGGVVSHIPAGLNLGGSSMMRLPTSVLFFHRMKLRNSTYFQVNQLKLDMANMTLETELRLNDLHLVGAYERSMFEADSPHILTYMPSFGEIQILLKDVNYVMEGRLRLLNKRLLIELVNSEIITQDILMMYVRNNATISTPTRIQAHNIEEFLLGLKCDLDKWLKDYFNDYLMYHVNFKSTTKSHRFLEYEKKKTVQTNKLADYILENIRKRLAEYNATTVKIPDFAIVSDTKMLTLQNGVLRGLDTIYRRSVATTRTIKKVRKIDAIVGFSKLKVEYQYVAVMAGEQVPLEGSLILSADELTAHMALSHITNPQTVDIDFDHFVQTSPESLIVEGPANRVISNFKHLLENSIVDLMSNTLMHNVLMMKSLTRCEPYLYGNDEKKLYPKESTNVVSDSSASDHTNSEKDSAVKKSIPDNETSSKDAESAENNSSGENQNDDSTPNSNYHSDTESSDIKAEFNNFDFIVNHTFEDVPKAIKDADYFMTKNESVELEVPVDGKIENMKLKNYNVLTLTKT